MPPNSAPTRRAKGAQREHIVLQAAVDVIAELGLANVRMSDIAKRAGMSVGHVTYYFPTKSRLLIRALSHSEDSFHLEVENIVADVRDPWRRLQRLVEAATASGVGDVGWMLWFEVWAQSLVDPDIATAESGLTTWWLHALQEAIDHGVRSGVFWAPSQRQAERTLAALVTGVSVQLTLGASGATRRNSVSLVMASARDLLTPPVVE